MMLPKKLAKLRFKKNDGTEFPEWETRRFSELFAEYSKTNEGNLVQYTVGKNGLKHLSNDALRYDEDHENGCALVHSLLEFA